MSDWNEIKNEFINGGVTYGELSEKYGVSLSAVYKHAKNEKWVELKKEVVKNTEESSESETLLRITSATECLLEKLEEATKQLNTVLVKDKRKYVKKETDELTGEEYNVTVEEEMPKVVKTEQVNIPVAKQIVSVLKCLKDFHKTTEVDEDDKIVFVEDLEDD